MFISLLFLALLERQPRTSQIGTLWADHEKCYVTYSQWYQYLNSHDTIFKKAAEKPKVFYPRTPLPKLKQEKRVLYPCILFTQKRNWRQKFTVFIEKKREALSSVLKKHDIFGLSRHLLLAEKEYNGKDQILRLFGLVHLANQTGIHLYLGAKIIFWIWAWIAFFFQWRAEWAKPIAHIICWLFFVSLWCLTGLRLGFIRPFFSWMIRNILSLLGLKVFPGIPLVLAMLIDMILNPLEPFIAKAVYFLSVAGCLLWAEKLFNDYSWKQHLYLSIFSFLPVGLLEVFHSQQIALLTPILNLLCFPIIFYWIFPGFLLGICLFFIFPPCGVACLEIINSSFSYLVNQLLNIAFLPGNLWHVSKKIAIFCIFLAAFITLIAQIFPYIRFICVCMAIILIVFQSFSLQQQPSQNAHQVVGLNAGQADATAIFISNQLHFIDIGSPYSFTDMQWLEFFAAFQIQSISSIHFTHTDMDHIGALEQLCRIIPIHAIYHPEIKSIPFSCRSKVLQHSLFPSYFVKIRRQQNSSMVGYRILLTDQTFFVTLGDAHSEAEKKFLPWLLPFSKKIKILKISHHGSKHSSQKIFLEALQPQQAWIYSQRLNAYGHPDPRVLSTLEELHIPIYHTATDGTLLWKQKDP